jgi:hypothetical protein
MVNHPDAIKSSRRIQCSSVSIRTTWKYHPDAIQSSTSNRVSVSDTNMGRELQTVRTMWCSRPDAILGRKSCSKSATVWTRPCYGSFQSYFGKTVAVDRLNARSSRPDALQYFDHNFLLKYRIGMKLVSLES